MELRVLDVRFADETEMEQLYYNYGEAHLLDDSGRTYAQIIRTGTILIKFALCLVQSISIAYICLLRNMKEKSLANQILFLICPYSNFQYTLYPTLPLLQNP